MIEKLRKMAEAFVTKVKEFPEVEEVAIAGSVASDDKYARDCDLAVIMSGFSGIGDVARAARQMSSIFHGWDVFVFDSHRNYREESVDGRIVLLPRRIVLYQVVGKFPI
ncbi:MAG: hypothetical protein H8E54_12115 [Candidatus Aminicenantes bacterium]|nr:hypothetical protein [Candidatus Aminicenantes bacterium]